MKQAQVRMTETIGVMFIFFILIALGLVFYYQYQQYAFKEKEQVLLQTRAVETTLRALFLPELLCSKGEAESEEHCIDMLKAESLALGITDADLERREYYFNLFSYATISVVQLYPPSALDSESHPAPLLIYNWPKEEYKSKENTFFVVALRDETIGGYSFGYLQVEVYS